MQKMSEKYLIQIAQDAGWNVGFASEARVALALQRLGYQSREQFEKKTRRRSRKEDFVIETQFKFGPYILDFALPWHQLAIEADGDYHVFKGKHDSWRDRRLEEWGWKTIRIATGTLEVEGVVDLLKERLGIRRVA